LTAARPQVLVVGAGALGLTCAHHLQRAGAAISLLVRPHRVAALSRPQRLYRYDDHSLQTLDGFGVLSDPAEIRGRQFDFVLLTLDGATCRSEQGVATLRALGAALAGTGTKLIIAGVGLGLYEHVQSITGVDSERLLQGTMKIFAYQVAATDTPRPPAAQAALHDSADIAYLRFPDRVGFVMASTPKAAARAFAALYDNSDEVTCQLLPETVYRATTSMFSPFVLASALDGWRGTESLLADQQLWPLCCRAQREILRLKQFGLVGKLLALLMSDASLAKKMRATERDAAPMGYTAFNRFHHGAKVLAQNVQIIENCIAAGERPGQEMAANRSLLAKYRELDEPASGQRRREWPSA
jgi:ketopantoate reductase